MENNEAVSKIKDELQKISDKLNSSANALSEEGLQLIAAQLSVVSQTLETLELLSKKNETQMEAAAEETIPVNIEQVVGMSLENNIPEEVKKEEAIPVVKKTITSLKEEKPDNSLAGKMKNKPIKDLKAAIGINEKFAFIKLYGGDATAWNNALQKLNSFSDYWEAESLLDEYSKQYNWKEEDETFLILSDLVQRRYL